MSVSPFSAPLWRRLLAIAVSVALFTAVSAAFLRLCDPAETPSQKADSAGSPAAPVPSPSTAAPSPCAYLRAWEGRLAVFRPSQTTPAEVHEVFLQTLPPAEQQLLQAGIPVYSEEELQRLLEDYTG